MLLRIVWRTQQRRQTRYKCNKYGCIKNIEMVGIYPDWKGNVTETQRMERLSPMCQREVTSLLHRRRGGSKRRKRVCSGRGRGSTCVVRVDSAPRRAKKIRYFIKSQQTLLITFTRTLTCERYTGTRKEQYNNLTTILY